MWPIATILCICCRSPTPKPLPQRTATANSGRGGRGGQGTGYPGLRPPATPSVGVLADASRLPGEATRHQASGRRRDVQLLRVRRACASRARARNRSTITTMPRIGTRRCPLRATRPRQMRLARENSDRPQRRSGRRSTAVRRALQSFRRWPAADRGSGLQRRTVEWIYDVPCLGSSAAIKKPGIDPAFKSPCLSRRFFYERPAMIGLFVSLESYCVRATL